MLEPTFAAVFLTGLLGGVHCAAMCGGIVGALSLAGEGGARRPRTGASVPLRFVRDPLPAPALGSGSALAASPPSRAGLVAALGASLGTVLPYNLGRLATYTVLGAAAGTIGSVGWLLGEALPLQQIAYAASSALVVAMGLYVAGVRRFVHRLEGLGRGLWRPLRPWAVAALARADAPGGAVLAGALWGLVPCGMVYAALASALLSGSAVGGAALMLAFGAGTLPNLLLLGGGSRQLAALARRPAARRLAGLAIALFGLLGLLRLDVARDVPILDELCARLPGLGT